MKDYINEVEWFILDFIQYLDIFLFSCLPNSTNIYDNKKNICIVKKAEIVV